MRTKQPVNLQVESGFMSPTKDLTEVKE